ncbi:hypothetical protein Lal_00036785 [Lupinus albus]|uniref:Putative CRIB domain-containing protein n=1 Tax=Lupinus albus TaxID=3870 RepID=A0A6A4PTZ9_LUPAL|nr:putative CRIB domain-containing protein [Lupinus albus]KAF1888743.1 hypothetical protein Lal_00036785 [Lupinus albus]
MRNIMKRFIVLPFFLGCASHSSVELGSTKRTKEDSKSPIVSRREEEEDRSIITTKMKENKASYGNILVLAKPNVASAIHRLMMGIKSLSQLFFEKEDIEMEIGYPIDVKHVTHIGLDGSTTTNNIKGCCWENFKAPPISFNQFEFNMATQVHHSLLNDSSSKFG